VFLKLTLGDLTRFSSVILTSSDLTRFPIFQCFLIESRRFDEIFFSCLCFVFDLPWFDEISGFSVIFLGCLCFDEISKLIFLQINSSNEIRTIIQVCYDFEIKVLPDNCESFAPYIFPDFWWKTGLNKIRRFTISREKTNWQIFPEKNLFASFASFGCESVNILDILDDKYTCPAFLIISDMKLSNTTENSVEIHLKSQKFGKNLYTCDLTNFSDFPVFFREISMTHAGEFDLDWVDSKIANIGWIRKKLALFVSIALVICICVSFAL